MTFPVPWMIFLRPTVMSRVTIDCSFRGVKPVFIPSDHCRQHTGLAEKRMDKKDNNKDLNE